MPRVIASRLAIINLIALGLTLLAPVVPAQVALAANMLMVSTTGADSGDCRTAACRTIGYALSQASPSGGDTITVAANTPAVPTYQENDSIVVDRNITLVGAGAAATIFDSSNHHQSGVVVHAGVAATISGFTFQHGNANAGSVVNNGTLTLISSVVANNTATSADGAGIGNGGLMSIIDCTITGNSASSGQGGGIANGGTLSVTNTTISGNDASAGGGIVNGPRPPTSAPGATLTVTESALSGNTGPFEGGGMLNNTGMVTITDTTIVGNMSSHGGGLFNNDRMTVARSLLAGNMATTANGAGGGIRQENGAASISLTNSTVSGNTAAGTSALGGGISVAFGSLALTNVTVSRNSATTGGGGVDNFGATVTSTDTIIAGNTGGQYPDVSGTFTSGGHNLIGNADGGVGFTGPGDLTGTTVSPLDAKLGPLARNGGPTQTHALLDGSPAYNGGGAMCPAGIATDQRGVPRPQGPACDIGAFEVQISALPPPRPPGQIVGSPTALPTPRPTGVPPGGPPVSTPNPLPPHR
ncbi:MAG: choice-of-anchor Q domain-containing protein [Thermomicrobiales bacterium]